MDKYQAVLDALDEQFEIVKGEYQQSLDAKEVTPRLAATINHMVHDGRTVFDYLANDIIKKYGEEEKRTYYPLAGAETQFPGQMENDLPGVTAKRPEIADVIEKYQPYRLAWLRYLSHLSKENKHRDLTPQTKKQRVQRGIWREGGKRAGVSWDPERTQMKGFVFDRSILLPDNKTLFGPDELSVRDETYVDWQFTELGVSALGVLGEIHRSARPAVNQIRAVAGV